MCFVPRFTGTKDRDDVLEDGRSDVDIRVPLKRYEATVSFTSEFGPNVYQDVLYVCGGSPTLEVVKTGKYPVGIFCHFSPAFTGGRTPVSDADPRNSQESGQWWSWSPQ